MSEKSITHKDDGSPCVPGGTNSWEAWVSASRVRNYCVQDPILDWLSTFGEARGFMPDQKQPGYDPRTDFLKFLFAKGQELSDRMSTFVEHLIKVGAGLSAAVDSYNAAVGSFETRLLPSARKFKALGAGGKRDVDELEPIDQTPRLLAEPDVNQS